MPVGSHLFRLSSNWVKKQQPFSLSNVCVSLSLIENVSFPFSTVEDEGERETTRAKKNNKEQVGVFECVYQTHDTERLKSLKCMGFYLETPRKHYFLMKKELFAQVSFRFYPLSVLFFSFDIFFLGAGIDFHRMTSMKSMPVSQVLHSRTLHRHTRLC